LFGGHVTPDHEVYKKFNLDKNKPILLFVQHSVTEEVLDTERQIIESLEALNKLGYQTVAVLNNSDAGSNIIRRAIMEHKKQFLQLHPNLARKDYAGLMKVASVMVGNSSSGIIEAPAMKLATVNIGNRQRNRVQSSNVINVGHNRIEIIRAVRKAITPAFQKRVEACTSPYGDGKSAKKIVAILEKIPIGEELLVKKITY
jgi:GDP/UDP-N,N'-diacetylbacillosamine 2-epimerase (hydrolysing)